LEVDLRRNFQQNPVTADPIIPTVAQKVEQKISEKDFVILNTNVLKMMELMQTTINHSTSNMHLLKNELTAKIDSRFEETQVSLINVVLHKHFL
jgi:hypothetical protein